MATELSPRRNTTKGRATGSDGQSSRTGPGSGWLPALLLVVGTLIAYQPIWHAGFIWDDDSFLYNNPLIRKADGLYRFWFTTQAPDYFPLTSTSLWLEWRLWGMHPLGYHLVNVLLHALSAVLLWRVLARLRLSNAWVAAAIFAVHPVNVQSVAWITERKNTLAMVFFLLSVWGYIKSQNFKVQSPKSTVHSSPSSTPRAASQDEKGFRVQGSGADAKVYYFLSLGAFLLALLSKTAVAPLPCVLLLCDLWMNRTAGLQDHRTTRQQDHGMTRPATPSHDPRFTHHVSRLVPCFCLSLVIGLVSLWFQSHRAIGNDVVRMDGFWGRLAGAGWAFWFYLSKAIWPLHLSPVYMRWQIMASHGLAWLPVLLMTMLAVGVVLWTAATCRRFRTARHVAQWQSADFSARSKELLFALGYFVLMLGPVLGFLNIYFMRYSLVADHWEYFAIIGPISLIAGSLGSMLKARRASPSEETVETVSAAFAASTTPLKRGVNERDRRSNRWAAKGSKDMMVRSLTRLLIATARPAVAALLLALGLLTWRQCGYYRDVETFWRATIAANPASSMAHNNLGQFLLAGRRVDEAMTEFEKALQIQPRGEIHNNLAHALLAKGQTDQALEHSYQAVKMEPGNPELHFNLGEILFRTGRKEAGIAEFRKALEIQPKLPMAHNNLGYALMETGKTNEALEHFRKAVEIDPESAHAHFALAYALARSAEASSGEIANSQLDEAITHYQKAVKLEPTFAPAHNGLGRALASKGLISEARVQYQRALELEPNYAPACNNLAWLLATSPEASVRDGPKALELARHAEQLSGGRDAAILRTLAAAYAEIGQFTEALATAQRAAQLAMTQGNAALRMDIETQINLYQAGQPVRDTNRLTRVR